MYFLDVVLVMFFCISDLKALYDYNKIGFIWTIEHQIIINNHMDYISYISSWWRMPLFNWKLFFIGYHLRDLEVVNTCQHVTRCQHTLKDVDNRTGKTYRKLCAEHDLPMLGKYHIYVKIYGRVLGGSKWVTTLVINWISGGNVHLYLGL